ncbi:hypothetical protein BC940DRAFT_297760 [Gongronella butleri]|nr:hypothetical protein BC940DRAFT_297760 [Gongronella butleri]
MPHSSIVSKALTLARVNPPQTTTTSINGHTTDHAPPKIRGIHAGTQTDQPKPPCDMAIQHNSDPVLPSNELPPTRRPPDQTASSLMRVYAELEPRPVRTAPRAPIPAAVIAALTSSTAAVPARRRRAIPYTLQENGYPTAHLRPRTHSPPAAPAPVPGATPATQPATRPRMTTQTSPPPTPSPTSSSPGVTVPARRKRVPWTSEEECALEDGVREFGTDWDQIAREYSPIFITNARTPEDIKNKAQATLKKRKRSYNSRSLSPFHILDA